MFKYPYETTPCSSYQLKEIVSSLQHAIIDGELGTAKTLKNTPVEGLREVPPHNKSVPPFSHPLVFDHFGKTQYVIDVRPFVSQLRADNSIKITAPGEYQFMVLRGMLTMGWSRGDVGDFASFGDLPARVFVRLLAEGIVRRLGLNPENHQVLAILAGFFYFSQFETDSKLDEQTTLKIATRISRVTAINVEKVLSVIEPLETIQDLAGFCHTAKAVLHTPRAEMLNPVLLASMTSGMWFGAAAKEVMVAALEYPPYLFALIYMAVNDRGYHNAGFTKLVESVARGSIGRDFSNNIVAYLESLSHV